MCAHAQLGPTLYDPIDYSPPGSSVHGILQARILEWIVLPLLQGMVPTQGLNSHLLCLMYWQADSLPNGITWEAPSSSSTMDTYNDIFFFQSKENSAFTISFSEYNLNAQPSTIQAPMPPHSGNSFDLLQ